MVNSPHKHVALISRISVVQLVLYSLDELINCSVILNTGKKWMEWTDKNKYSISIAYIYKSTFCALTAVSSFYTHHTHTIPEQHQCPSHDNLIDDNFLVAILRILWIQNQAPYNLNPNNFLANRVHTCTLYKCVLVAVQNLPLDNELTKISDVNKQ